jgi:GDP-D-mannose dehydratase
MKKALIIGAAGFVGPYLAEELSDRWGMEVHATKRSHGDQNKIKAELHTLNILNKEEIIELLYRIRPDYIFHLAAQSSVALSWKDPGLTIDVNIKGSVNLMDAVRELYYKPRVLLIGSGEEYGHIRSGETPITEENHLRPGNLYAATKVCQNMIAGIYTTAYDMELIMVRAFNHIGPGQAPIFVVSDFCKQVVEIEKGLHEPVMMVGNLKARRDFTDVRDVVRAYALLVQHGKAGETYNVGSGQAVEIQEVLKKIISQSSVDVEIRVDPNKIRPVDVPIIEADTTKLQQTTGWKREISLEQTIHETMEYWRQYIG